jgi:acyl carrier protein
LTEERFVPDPFKPQAGARIYRTGDLGRWLEDGTIECLGRSDNQVKLRGQRIELGEIEAALCQCAGIREAAVIVQGDADSEKRLIAYVVSTTENSPDSAEIKAKLKEVLHEAMMPSAFIFLDKLPLTPNGKIDRKALPQSQAKAPVVLPESRPKTASHMENEIISIWAGILKMEAVRIGLTDNFFELGGHSLLVVQMHSRLKEKLGADLPLARLFQYTTPASLAAHLNEGKESQMQSTLQRGALKRRGFKNPAKKQEELPV